MAFRIPGTTAKVRLFDRVATTDEQYDVFDVGVEHEDGSIDSLVVGGSFASARRAIENMNSKADAKVAEAA